MQDFRSKDDPPFLQDQSRAPHTIGVHFRRDARFQGFPDYDADHTAGLNIYPTPSRCELYLLAHLADDERQISDQSDNLARSRAECEATPNEQHT